MELKQVKKGDPIIRSEDGRLIGYAASDGIQITVEPHEIATFKRCFLVTNEQLVQTLQYKKYTVPVQIEMVKS
jgi:hypothetical protein